MAAAAAAQTKQVGVSHSGGLGAAAAHAASATEMSQAIAAAASNTAPTGGGGGPASPRRVNAWSNESSTPSSSTAAASTTTTAVAAAAANDLVSPNGTTAATNVNATAAHKLGATIAAAIGSSAPAPSVPSTSPTPTAASPTSDSQPPPLLSQSSLPLPSQPPKLAHDISIAITRPSLLHQSSSAFSPVHTPTGGNGSFFRGSMTYRTTNAYGHSLAVVPTASSLPPVYDNSGEAMSHNPSGAPNLSRRPSISVVGGGAMTSGGRPTVMGPNGVPILAPSQPRKTIHALQPLERKHTFSAINALHPHLSGVYQRTVTEWDCVVTRKNNRLAFYAMLSTVLGIVSLELGWDGKEWSYSPAISAIQIALSCLTVLHMWFVYDYYLMEIDLDRIKYAVFHEISIWRSARLPWLLLELAVTAVHAPPYLDLKKLTLFIGLRNYVLVRCYRDRSDIYTMRKRILMSGDLQYGIPRFHWWFSVQALFYVHPWKFVLVITSVILFMFSYCLYVLERESQPAFNFGVAMYFVCTTMTTVGYGDFHAETGIGQAFSMAAAAIGVAMAGLMVTAMLRSFQLNFNQLIAADMVEETVLEQKEKRLAAQLIQEAVRFHQRRKRTGERARPIWRVDRNMCGAPASWHLAGSRLSSIGACTSCGCSPMGCTCYRDSHQALLRHAKEFRKFRFHHMLSQMDDSDLVTRSITSLDKRVETMETTLNDLNELVRSQSEFIAFQTKVLNQFVFQHNSSNDQPSKPAPAPFGGSATDLKGLSSDGETTTNLFDSDGNPLPTLPGAAVSSSSAAPVGSSNPTLRRWRSESQNGLNDAPAIPVVPVASSAASAIDQLAPLRMPSAAASNSSALAPPPPPSMHHHQPLSVLVETPRGTTSTVPGVTVSATGTTATGQLAVSASPQLFIRPASYESKTAAKPLSKRA